MTGKTQPLQRRALRIRARAKHKKPAFVRPESWRYDKFSLSWRRPRGLDNKVRRKIKGWPPSPSVGYKGPKIARGLHPSGYREVLVYNVGAVKAVDAATQAIRIAHTVGKRKRALIVDEAKKLNIKILNAQIAPAPEAESAEKAEGTKEPVTLAEGSEVPPVEKEPEKEVAKEEVAEKKEKPTAKKVPKEKKKPQKKKAAKKAKAKSKKEASE